MSHGRVMSAEVPPRHPVAPLTHFPAHHPLVTSRTHAKSLHISQCSPLRGECAGQGVVDEVEAPQPSQHKILACLYS
ncbi:hypothetical protein E2C01_095182 [Portunus trituberculatus]|uniref:Uncharacterized protein n=1 Tax=Portunus trituberculatus TaxID=210409 RepID=A0A5B7K3J0_PORTR|nr:hypothetical protein [Portunus trituberculatus]